MDAALLALGRLDSITTLLPDTGLFLYTYVRKEAVLFETIHPFLDGNGRVGRLLVTLPRSDWSHCSRTIARASSSWDVALQAAGAVREITGPRRNRVFVYDPYLKILSEGTEPL